MRPEKQQLAQDVGALLGPSPSVFLMTYKGLTVKQISQLREGLAQLGAECHVVPNRILRRAAKEAGVDALAELKVQGDTAMVTGGTDPVAVAKVLRDFVKDHNAMSFKDGVVGRRAYPAADMERLATLPTLDVARAQLLGLLEAPMRQLLGVLNAKNASILYVLQAYLNKQENPS